MAGFLGSPGFPVMDPLSGMQKRSFVTSADEHHERALARSEPLPN